jgi:hypothetical protein
MNDTIEDENVIFGSLQSMWQYRKNMGFIPCCDATIPVPIECVSAMNRLKFLASEKITPSEFIASILNEVEDIGSVEIFKSYTESQQEYALLLLTMTLHAFSKLTQDLLEMEEGPNIRRLQQDEEPHHSGMMNFPTSSISKSAIKIPPVLSRALWNLCVVMNRPPVLSYASIILFNCWIPPETTEIRSLDEIKIRHTFTNSKSEFNFYRVHFEAEWVARFIVYLSENLWRAVEDKDYNVLATTLLSVADIIGALHKPQKDLNETSVHSDTFYNSIRSYFNYPCEGIQFTGLEGTPLGGQSCPLKYRGASGAGMALVPYIDLLLGIDVQEMTLQTILNDYFSYMPAPHRLCLNRAKKHTKMVRAAILAYVQNDSNNKLSVFDAELGKKMVFAYNLCVEGMMQFRSRHQKHVDTYIINQLFVDGKKAYATHGSLILGTGSTNFVEYLKSHAIVTKNARIYDE